jgi:predicted homoserine dehydrogenase-like protein
MPAEDSLRLGGLPIGLAHHLRLAHPVKAGRPLHWSDVVLAEASDAVRFRREMEQAFAPKTTAAA